MIGKKVFFAYGNPDSRIEGSGVIMDKVSMTDIIQENDKVTHISPHDIYLIKEDDDSLKLIHPMHLIKIL